MKRYFRVQPRCIFLDAMSPIATSDGLSWRRQERYFVTQLTGDAQSAVYAVNAMEHNPTACALIDVVYFRGPRIEVARHGDSSFAVGFGFALNTHPKLKRVSDLYRCAAKISSGSLVLRCVKEFAMRAGAEGGRTLKTCLVILLLNTPSQSRCRALKPPEMVGKSAKVDSGILCHSGQLERGTKTRIATLRAHVGADK
jgi:hypothetical protein